jgi:hypothetical protein
VTHLLLFDIDGVLVDPQGYLKALQDTVAHFTRLMGAGEQPPSEHDVRVFEAHGITSEWDSGAICTAYALLGRILSDPPPALESDWEAALAQLGATTSRPQRPAYASLAARIGPHIAPGTGVAEAARALLWHDALGAAELAPLVPALARLLEHILGHTYDFHRSPITRYFQQLVLGPERVRRTYGVEAVLEEPSYLETYDRPLLEESSRLRLHETCRSTRTGAALYTARPSLPPAGTQPQGGYSPEAELARSLVGLEPFPIVGLGSLSWLAYQVGETVEHLVKPSPVQALAAVGVAALGEQRPALEAAYALHTTGRLRGPLAQLQDGTIHVFEDAPTGLAAAARAVDSLHSAGASLELRAYAVSAQQDAKRSALQAKGVPIFPSVNDALAAALEAISAAEGTEGG